jgi:hypothetical protein
VHAFVNDLERLDLQLLDKRCFASGVVHLRYLV